MHQNPSPIAAAARLIDRIAAELPTQARPFCRAFELPPRSFAAFPSRIGLGFWHAHGSGHRLLAFGQAVALAASGPDRFAHLGEEFARLRRDLGVQAPAARFLFQADFAPGDGSSASVRAWLPLVTLEHSGARCRLLVAGPGDWRGALAELFDAVQPGALVSAAQGRVLGVRALPSPEHWRDQAVAAVAAIARGDLAKIVLSRALAVELDRAPDPMALLRRLAGGPATLIAVQRGEDALIAASPERLLSLRKGLVQCDALAGTIARDADAARERALGQALLGDPKNRHEHALVVAALRRALSPLCSEVLYQAEPALFRGQGVQHLRTRVSARVRDGVDALALVAALHPTPAVGGEPRRAALAWLAAHEQAPRGPYAGVAGWIGGDGDAELNVVLRCAQLSGHGAVLHAGAGLVAGSDPDDELAETELKLGVMARALGLT